MTNPTISRPHYAKISTIIHTLKLGVLPISTKQMMQLQDLQRKIGKEIKKLRCMNDWTQEEVAEKLDICRNAYGDMERGETDINLSRLMQVSELFGVDINSLFSWFFCFWRGKLTL